MSAPYYLLRAIAPEADATDYPPPAKVLNRTVYAFGELTGELDPTWAGTITAQVVPPAALSATVERP